MKTKQCVYKCVDYSMSSFSQSSCQLPFLQQDDGPLTPPGCIKNTCTVNSVTKSLIVIHYKSLHDVTYLITSNTKSRNQGEM